MTAGGDRGGGSALESSVVATIEGYTFRNEDNGFSVVRLKDDAGRALTAVGHMAHEPPGSTVRLRGAWVRDRNYGTQFRFESCELVRPDTLVGMERYLGSGLVKGVGPALASRIVERFGLETMDVIDNEPDRLVEVEGIGRKRLERIKAAWDEQREIRKIMVFLQGLGVSPALAARIYRRYGAEAVERVSRDPFRLADEVWGVGFATADRIAGALGVEGDSPARIKAGILSVLSRAADSGHCYLPEDEAARGAAELLGVEASAAAALFAELAAEGRIMLDGGRIYLTRLFEAEQSAAARLAELLAAPSLLPIKDASRAVEWAQQRMGLELAPAQRSALEAVLTGKVNIITGGPGTGKTTILKAILLIARAKDVKTALAAPTGRAARRLAEAAGAPASTIHRLLDYDPATGAFKRCASAPLEADLVIIDETSMVDTVLLSALVAAVPSHAGLVFVGDVDQLPSVGPGAALAEMIESGAVPVARLTEIFRQSRGSLISTNARNINLGRALELHGAPAREKDFFCIFREDAAELADEVVSLCSERLPRRYGFDPVRHIQVLAPMNRGEAGIENLNALLRARLNPPSPRRREMRRGALVIREGDKVIQLRNNYDKEVFNGDMGVVTSVDAEEGAVEVDFYGRRVDFDGASELDELQPAYALSIHKSQGGEYPCVVVALHSSHYVMLRRRLLYTAVTRGKRLVVLVASRKALAVALREEREEHRHTALSERIVEACRNLSGADAPGTVAPAPPGGGGAG
ncbi:MAG TPA: ATP-dependent RecD-like DNA helicase [Deltaproteobacteria bacterium]|nr:ATP-dependent RecD-like DNA helicase [Deltaproteobacteria bacterium]